MATQQLVEVLAVGMTTPVGLSAPASAAAVRAGISRLKKSTIYVNAFQPAVMGLLEDKYLPPVVPALNDALAGHSDRHRRMLRLATLPLKEASNIWKPPVPPPLLVALPEVPSARPDPLAPTFLEQLILQAGVEVNRKQSRVFRNGRAGGLLALQHGMELLATRQATTVYVGGVDTYLDLHLLATLGVQQRLRVHGNPEGFIPGEGAAFLLLAAAGTARSAQLSVLAHITGTGVGNERGHLYSEHPHQGDGLADSFRALFSARPSQAPRVRSVYAGMNGEHFWGKEWGVAYLRNAMYFEESHHLEHPAEYFGDPGAALGTILAALASIGLYKGYRRGPALVWCGSDHEDRATVLIDASRTGGS